VAKELSKTMRWAAYGLRMSQKWRVVKLSGFKKDFSISRFLKRP
jgi:hypothetical protein